MLETIQIPRAWLEGLIEFKNYTVVHGYTDMGEEYLCGLVESAKSLLTERAKDTK